MVRPERLEPPTHGLEGRCSILLSYRRVNAKELRQSLNRLERVMGIEPTQPAWKASVLPLNYTRIVCSAFSTIEPGAHNSMLRNYSKSIFLCQLIFVTIFLNLHFILSDMNGLFART